jgi:hypothetical protein
LAWLEFDVHWSESYTLGGYTHVYTYARSNEGTLGLLFSPPPETCDPSKSSFEDDGMEALALLLTVVLPTTRPLSPILILPFETGASYRVELLHLGSSAVEAVLIVPRIFIDCCCY